MLKIFYRLHTPISSLTTYHNAFNHPRQLGSASNGLSTGIPHASPKTLSFPCFQHSYLHRNCDRTRRSPQLLRCHLLHPTTRPFVKSRPPAMPTSARNVFTDAKALRTSQSAIIVPSSRSMASRPTARLVEDTTASRLLSTMFVLALTRRLGYCKVAH